MSYGSSKLSICDRSLYLWFYILQDIISSCLVLVSISGRNHHELSVCSSFTLCSGGLRPRWLGKSHATLTSCIPAGLQTVLKHSGKKKLLNMNITIIILKRWLQTKTEPMRAACYKLLLAYTSCQFTHISAFFFCCRQRDPTHTRDGRVTVTTMDTQATPKTPSLVTTTVMTIVDSDTREEMVTTMETVPLVSRW